MTFLWPLGVSAEPRVPAAVIESSRPAPLMFQAPPSDNGLQQSLVLAKRNVLDLRLQLNHIRHIQVLICVVSDNIK